MSTLPPWKFSADAHDLSPERVFSTGCKEKYAYQVKSTRTQPM